MKLWMNWKIQSLLGSRSEAFKKNYPALYKKTKCDQCKNIRDVEREFQNRFKTPGGSHYFIFRPRDTCLLFVCAHTFGAQKNTSYIHFLSLKCIVYAMFYAMWFRWTVYKISEYHLNLKYDKYTAKKWEQIIQYQCFSILKGSTPYRPKWDPL